MMILNKTRSKMIDFCKKKKKDLMEVIYLALNYVCNINLSFF